MARFVRREDPPRQGDADAGEHAELPGLIQRVQAYSPPMVPDATSGLSLREQHLRGFLFNRRKATVPSRDAGPR
jgi:hypothetical protein